MTTVIITLKENGLELEAKRCTKCKEIKNLDLFPKGKDAGGKHAHCKGCFKKRYQENRERLLKEQKIYRDRNKEEISKREHERRKRNRVKNREIANKSYAKNKHKYKEKKYAYKKEWKRNNPEKAYRNMVLSRKGVKHLFYSLNREEFDKLQNKKCIFTGGESQFDHFIPTFTGHCGTYVENLTKLNGKINGSKGKRNPFEWIKKQSPEYQDKFMKEVNILALGNGLTVNEYEDFVHWCYQNKRTEEEIIKDQRHSIEIWREITGFQFPLPEYCYRKGE